MILFGHGSILDQRKKAPIGATTRTDEASWPGSGRLHERIENGRIILAIR
jgi:hypothetical protein